MESPASTVRRRAWINSSRQWVTLEDPDPEAQPFRLPSASLVDDDVFSDSQSDSPRCFTGKIESWLLGCGLESSLENVHQLSFEKAGNFHDDLSLGADAYALNGGQITPGADFAHHPSIKQRRSRLTSSTPRQQLCMPSLSLGQSMASSCPSSSTCKTSSSVSEVLKMCSEDAEETLYELGFGSDEPQVTVRIPPRFFTFPSQAQGINFRLFLDSQLRRIREEDPSLSLASRFRQVQVLTAMANAFYSLYSHVSRTPVQKLATPEFNFSSPVEKIERFRSNIRSEPRSPVERLKDTVSKMCLYTGSPRGSDSTSPQLSPSKQQSLPDVVDIMLEKVKPGVNKKLDLEEPDDRNSAMDVIFNSDGDKSCYSCQEEQTQLTVRNTIEAVQDSEQTDKIDTCENSVNLEDTDSKTHSTRTSLASSLSGETVIEVGRQFVSFPSERKSDSSQRMADLKAVAKVSYDLICPQIVENVHQAPFSCQYIHGTKTNILPLISSETESTDRACPISHRNHETQTGISAAYEQSCFGPADVSSLGTQTQVDTSQIHLLAANCSSPQYCITVTVEGEDISSSSLNTLDSSHISTLPPAQTCEESTGDGKSQYLNPMTHHGQGHNSSNLQQVNSFELEEMHSAGEDDFGQPEHGRTAASPLSTKRQFKGEVARGDSVQSDSSGYAEEEVSPSPRIND
ncbi:protein TESPA1 isoform X2 [Sphaeramia orbicularis]|uniref:protein TESPA1 isoform X2 n=1 Tax=Sphaeramia orbicularis TaxID=375764 RepID=UPI00117DACE1|nr:protein TESPA1 isoform X2 [Sphaeramia orbicularis]